MKAYLQGVPSTVITLAVVASVPVHADDESVWRAYAEEAEDDLLPGATGGHLIQANPGKRVVVTQPPKEFDVPVTLCVDTPQTNTTNDEFACYEWIDGGSISGSGPYWGVDEVTDGNVPTTAKEGSGMNSRTYRYIGSLGGTVGLSGTIDIAGKAKWEAVPCFVGTTWIHPYVGFVALGAISYECDEPENRGVARLKNAWGVNDTFFLYSCAPYGPIAPLIEQEYGEGESTVEFDPSRANVGEMPEDAGKEPNGQVSSLLAGLDYVSAIKINLYLNAATETEYCTPFDGMEAYCGGAAKAKAFINLQLGEG